jgi:hypothetical protein
MRRWALVLLAASAYAASAAPPPAPLLTWADWVGDWGGKLRWSGCTVDGEPAAALAIDAVDGSVAIDLTPAGGALAAVTLVAHDDAGWDGHAGDVRVHVTRGASTLEVAVDLDSGCAMRGSLRRASVGIAACDELEAWARIEGRCTKLVKPALENLARVANQRAEWSKARAEAKPKLALQCKARAQKVETELIDAGCAPDPDPPTAARDPECTSLRLAGAKITRCQTLPFDVAASLAHDANDLAGAVRTVDSDTSRGILEKQCRAMRERIALTAQQAGCSL